MGFAELVFITTTRRGKRVFRAWLGIRLFAPYRSRTSIPLARRRSNPLPKARDRRQEELRERTAASDVSKSAPLGLYPYDPRSVLDLLAARGDLSLGTST